MRIGVKQFRLMPLERVSSGRYRARCDCGREAIIDKGSKSCGCWRREASRARAYKDGRSADPLLAIWKAMIQRCENPNREDYRYYGGRGIAVCQRWRESFEAFRADMGPRPEGLTLDRRNPDGNYSKRNCRWATWTEQRLNRSVQ